MISQKEFKNLEKEKKWRYIQYLQGRRTNSYLLITNIVIIMLSFFTLILTVVQIPNININFFEQILFNKFIFIITLIIIIYASIFSIRKFSNNILMKKRLFELTKNYFHDGGKRY